MAVWPSTILELATPKDVANGSGGFYQSTYNLTSGANGIWTLPGVRGLDAPPFQLSYDEQPALDGGNARHVRALTREVFLPLHLEAPDRPSLLALKRGLIASLNPTYGPARITVTEGDNTSRFLDAYYVSGAEGDEGQDVAGFTWLRMGLTFRAMDPYWYSGTTVVRTFQSTAGELVPFFSDPFLGLHINRTHSLNQETQLTVSGDVETWPEWIITGPIDSAKFTRYDGATESSFELTTSLVSGDTVYIDTRPGQKQVTHVESGDNLWDSLGPNPNLWAVKPGQNTIRIDLEGTNNNTSVRLTYRPRFVSS